MMKFELAGLQHRQGGWLLAFENVRRTAASNSDAPEPPMIYAAFCLKIR